LHIAAVEIEVGVINEGQVNILQYDASTIEGNHVEGSSLRLGHCESCDVEVGISFELDACPDGLEALDSDEIDLEVLQGGFDFELAEMCLTVVEVELADLDISEFRETQHGGRGAGYSKEGDILDLNLVDEFGDKVADGEILRYK
jgi:hypothetical protein